MFFDVFIVGLDALSEARNKDLLEMESMLDAAPMEKNIITTKDRRKYDSSAQKVRFGRHQKNVLCVPRFCSEKKQTNKPKQNSKDFHPTVVLGAPSGVTSASPPGKVESMISFDVSLIFSRQKELFCDSAFFAKVQNCSNFSSWNKTGFVS